MSERIEKSVYDRLAASSDVTDIVGTSIFFINADQGTSMPYITMQRITTDPVSASNTGVTANKTTNVDMQINCLDVTYYGVKALAEAVRASLFGWSDSGGDPSISPALLTGESDDFDQPTTGKSTPTYRVIQSYSLWFSD